MSEILRAKLAWWLDLVRRIRRATAPFVDLWIRLCLAEVFFISGMLKLGNWHVALELARHEYPVSWLDPQIAAVLGAAVEVAGPVLLATGFLVRPAALAMLILSIVIQFSYQQLDVNLFWAALFGWYVVHGAGPLSIDRMVSKGFRTSVLPLAARAISAGDWFKHVVGPQYRLVLRLWLAVALIGVNAPHRFFPVATAAMLPHPWATIASALLAIGLGTPLVAAALVAISSGTWLMTHAEGTHLYLPLVFALLAMFGAGRFSLDDILDTMLRRRSTDDAAVPHVVIVGAGFGGVACAAALRRDRVRVTLIDRCNYHLFQPLLYQVATASLSPGDIATPVRGIFRDTPRVSVLRGTVSGVNTARQAVFVGSREVTYDYLVLATGASHGYFGHDEWAAHAPGLKSVEDALAIRSRILVAFERAEATEDPDERNALLTFLICGGGPTGVELAGAIAELARNGLEKEFRRFEPASARIILVQAGPRILPSLPEKLSTSARTSLERLGVKVLVGSRVEAIDHTGAVVNGTRIPAGTVLWAAGVVASPAAAWLKQPADAAGRLKVQADLSVPGLPNVFAIGDTALALAWKGAPVPGLAPAAKQSGKYVARIIHAELCAADPPPAFRYRHQGSLATIGRKAAVADLGWIAFRGAIAWWLWGAVHVFSLLSVRNRLSVMTGWMWSYFTYGVGVQIITGEDAVGAHSEGVSTPA